MVVGTVRRERPQGGCLEKLLFRVQLGFKGHLRRASLVGAAVKNPPADVGDMGSSPGPGRFPCAAEQLSHN